MQMYSGDIVSPVRTRKEGTMKMSPAGAPGRGGPWEALGRVRGEQEALTLAVTWSPRAQALALSTGF